MFFSFCHESLFFMLSGFERIFFFLQAFSLLTIHVCKNYFVDWRINLVELIHSFTPKSKLKSPQHFHKTELVLFRLLSTEMCACPVGGAAHFYRKCSFLPRCWVVSLSSPVLQFKSLGRTSVICSSL